MKKKPRVYDRYEIPLEVMAAEMNMTQRAFTDLLYKATKKFNAKLKERLGDDIQLYDIIESLDTKGDDYVSMLRL